MFFHSGWCKEFIWYYLDCLGLTLNLISFKIFEISSQRQYIFNSHQDKRNIQSTIFISISFLLIKVLQNKMIQKTNSVSINNHRHNGRQKSTV